MPLWGKANAKASAPKFAIIESQVANGPSRGNNTAFNNVSSGVFHPGQAIGVFGANSADIASRNTAGNTKNINHTGWHVVRQGTGPVKTFTVSVGGTGYANTDLIRVSGGTTNATGTLTTNATGGIVSATVTGGGKGFLNVANTTVAVTNSTAGASAGSGATIVPVLGGRAGRVYYECLVAGSITGSPPATLP
jgi:hypothetical protein